MKKRSFASIVEDMPDFWAGKRVFLTGHTGFKGSWLSLWLERMGAVVHGYSLAPETEPSLFDKADIGSLLTSQIADIRDLDAMAESMQTFAPEIVLHLAAQPLVRRSYRDPVETFSTNVMGCVNVLEGVRRTPSVRSVVMVTTDKCYENREWCWGYRENEAMGGHDPYSASKGCSELVTQAYRCSFFADDNVDARTGCAVASARAGNVIGGGDWSEDRLIPDIVESLRQGEAVRIRSPHSIRPWQHVIEPLCGYLVLAEKLYKDGQSAAEPWNFGPLDANAKPVQYIVEHMVKRWGAGSWDVDEGQHPHEASWLKLDCSKANSRLGWQAVWSLERSLDAIVQWHKSVEVDATSTNVRSLMHGDLDDYLANVAELQ